MAQPELKISDKFDINKIKNLTNNNDHDGSLEQVPFFLNVPGVPTLKGDKESGQAYVVKT